jgi:LDH2 family malate/lactate/ureidoglycolate dehydrogenase
MFDARALTDFAKAVLSKAGLPEEPSASVARGLVEADLLGHTTHGLALLADYAEEIAEGRMETRGRPEPVNERGAAATWDARRLPGIWTTDLAIESAVERAKRLGLGAIALKRSHHIACLAAFLEAPARQGIAVLVFSSDPGDSKVAPFGGLTPVLMPDPIAAGLPAEPDPIMIDISTSITTMAMTNRAKREGRRLSGRWLLSAAGEATDDPAVVGCGGTLLPIGGLDHGHKGFGLGLLVEMLTQGLSGYGRADGPSEWGAAVLVLAIDPEAFGGREAFLRQSGFIAQACRDAKPLAKDSPVRLPGAAGLGRKRRALAEGVALSQEIVSSLTELSRRLDIAMLAGRVQAGSRT